MATEKQIAANRQNAQKGTGPQTELGKRRSRRNAVRHGLTAETVISTHEDPTAYRALERAINADYRPQTNFELELVARLVSLLWRLRRAVAIESGLLNIEADFLPKKSNKTDDKLNVFYTLIPSLIPAADPNGGGEPNRTTRSIGHQEIARSFLRLTSADGAVFDRLVRYEMGLWRQTLQTILLLNAINRGSNDSAGNGNLFNLRHRARSPGPLLWPPFVRSR